MHHSFKFLIGVLLPVALLGSQSFSSTANTLVTSPGVSLPTSGTISVAIFPTYSQNDGLFHIMFESLGSVGVNQFSLIKGSANDIYLEIDNSASTSYVVTAASGSYTLTTSQWSVVSVTWTNGGDMYVYLNGVIIASSAVSGTPPLSWTGTGTQTWSIGNRAAGGFDQRGSEALVGIWNRVLTNDELLGVSIFYPPVSVAPSGLVSNWTMAGSSLVDSIGGHNLTATGTTTGTDPSRLNLGTSVVITPWIGFR